MNEFIDTAETMGMMSIDEMIEKEQILFDAGFSRCPNDMPIGPDTADIEFAFVFTEVFWRAK